MFYEAALVGYRIGNIMFLQQCFLRYTNRETLIGNIMFLQQCFLRWTNRETLTRNIMFLQQCFPEVDEQGNIDRKHNVSATMFPEVDKHRFAQDLTGDLLEQIFNIIEVGGLYKIHELSVLFFCVVVIPHAFYVVVIPLAFHL